MRRAIDTDVLVAAMRTPTDTSAERLVRLLNGQAAPLVGVALAFELETACTRRVHLGAARITEEETKELGDAIIDAIVTFNRKDDGTAPARFGIELLSPAEALRRIRK